MNIQFVSDLHLEFPENRQWLEQHPLPVTGDILLVAGDSAYLDRPTANPKTYGCYPFWDWASRNYQQVIICCGNHEFYGFYDVATLPDGYCLPLRPNVSLYYNAVVPVEDTDIIVTTLWSHIPPQDAYMVEHRMNDFCRIMYGGYRLSADTFNQEHDRCLAFLKKAVSESHAAHKVVLTHHVPTQLCIQETYRDSPISTAFMVELGNYIADSDIDYWIYGHSHYSIEVLLGRTRILSNQLGYIAHQEYKTNGFDPARHLEL